MRLFTMFKNPVQLSGVTAVVAAGVLLLTSITGYCREFAYFQYVQEPLNPRCVALGGAGTALSYGGFAFYNPAGPAFIDRPFISLDFGRQWSDLSTGSVETAWNFDKWFIGGSFSGGTVDYPLSDETGILPGSGSEQKTDLSFFTGLKRGRIAVGAAVNALPHFMGGENAFAVSASGGILGVLLPGKLTAGAAVVQAGRYHRGFYKTDFSAHRDSMATMVRAGAAWNDRVKTMVPYSLTADVEYEFGEDRVLVPVGLEVCPIEPLAVRIGKRFNHYSDVMTFGIGVRWENIAFDAAFVPTSLDGVNEMKWLMGIRYELPGKKDAEKRKTITGDTAMITPQADPADEQAHPADTAVREPDREALPQKNRGDTAPDSGAASEVSDTSSVNGNAAETGTVQSAVPTDATTTTDGAGAGTGAEAVSGDQAPGNTPASLSNDTAPVGGAEPASGPPQREAD